MTGFLIKRPCDDMGTGDTRESRPGDSGMTLPAPPPARISSSIRSWKRRGEGALPQSPREQPLLAPGFWASHLQSCERTHFCGCQPSRWSQQPQARNTGPEKQPGTCALLHGEAGCGCPSGLRGDARAERGRLRFRPVVGRPRKCVVSAPGSSAPAWTLSPTHA